MKIYHIEENTKQLIWLGQRLVDPFSKDIKLIHPNWINRYFTKTYSLTHLQIWNLVNNLDLDHVHLCNNPKCSQPTEMSKRHLNRGPNKYCSLKCHGYHKMTLMHANPEYKDMFANAQRLGGSHQITKYNEWLWHSEDLEAITRREHLLQICLQNLNNPESTAKGNRTRFLNMKSKKSGSLYLCKLDDESYKFGITEDMNNIFHSYINTANTEILITSTRLHVANLEYYLALYFSGERFDCSRKDEFMENFNLLLSQSNLEFLTDLY